MQKIVLLGAGGYCAGVIDSIRREGKYEIVGITDPQLQKECCGIPVIGTDDILYELYEKGIRCAHITVGSIAKPTIRKRLVRLAEEIGFELVSIIDPTAIISEYSTLGKMVYVAKGSIINATACIGDYAMINTGCIVEHGCKLDNWVHIAPGSTLAADISIGDSTHIGVHSVVLQGITIGKNVVVGAGSIIIRDVSDDQVVYGLVK